jgi:hypothetical protein
MKLRRHNSQVPKRYDQFQVQENVDPKSLQLEVHAVVDGSTGVSRLFNQFNACGKHSHLLEHALMSNKVSGHAELHASSIINCITKSSPLYIALFPE